MTLDRYPPHKKYTLTAPEFDRALVFTRMKDRTQQIARAYLVDHHTPGRVAERFGTSKQNVYRAGSQMLKDAEVSTEVFTGLQRRWHQLKISPEEGRRVLPFVMQEATLPAAAQQAGCTVQDVLGATKEVVRLYLASQNSEENAAKQTEYQQIMRFSRMRKRASQVAYDGFVLGITLSGLAEKYDITRQNAYNIMRRFEEARERYNACESEVARRATFCSLDVTPTGATEK